MTTVSERHDDLVVDLARRVSASLKDVLVGAPPADIVRAAVERAARSFLDDHPRALVPRHGPPARPPLHVARSGELARLGLALQHWPAVALCGVAGAGKSVLAGDVAREWSGGLLYQTVEQEDLGGLVDRAEALIGAAPRAGWSDVEARLTRLARHLDAGGLLWVLDDLHLLPEPDQVTLLQVVAPRLGAGRILATSRRLLPRAAVADQVTEVRIGGFDEADALALWSLEGGEAERFSAAFRRTGGLPLLLRRGQKRGDAGRLGSPLREIAGAIALCRIALPMDALSRRFCGGDDRPIRELVSRLVVIDGEGGCSIDELFREEVLDELDPPLRRSLHEQLAMELVEHAHRLEPVARAGEVVHHLHAAGRQDEAARFLTAHGAELLPGGALELTRLLEQVPPAHHGVEIRVLLARALLGSGEPRRALLALGDPADLGRDGLPTWMEVALVNGRVADALAALGAIEEPRSDALRCAALVLTHAGRSEQALALLDRAAVDPIDGALLAGCRAQCLWFGGRTEEAARCLVDAGLDRDRPTGWESPALLSLILAERGEVAEAERLLAIAEGAAASCPAHQVELGACRAFIQFERGDRCEAIEGLRAAATALERAGHLLGAWWWRVWLGGWLIQVGRRREGRQLLAATASLAQESGLASIVDAARRIAERDPLDVDPRIRRDKQGERARAAALAALRAAARGQAEEMTLRLGEVDALSGRPGYALDRVIAHLARAVILHMYGRPEAAAVELGEVIRIAAGEGVDADLIMELGGRLGDVLVVTGRCERQLSPAAAVDLTPYTVVIDARTHELRIAGETRSLRRRVVVRRLLYKLASQPGRIVPKPDLVEAAWDRPYDPLLHDDPIKSNILHLRRALNGTGIEIDFDDTGYCLHAPERFAFASPFVLWSDPVHPCQAGS